MQSIQEKVAELNARKQGLQEAKDFIAERKKEYEAAIEKPAAFAEREEREINALLGSKVPVSLQTYVEELAKFRVDHNTELVDGTTLKDNTYIKNDYGRTRIHLMPETNVNDIIVKLDLTEQYMVYPIFLKALLNCNIIENTYGRYNKSNYSKCAKQINDLIICHFVFFHHIAV